ncbi:MAG: M42 family metallopeptidase [Deltaproteobacteria bacterium]|nr:M42 family metallopeptidase [Deltaproteobacteria bacterium]
MFLESLLKSPSPTGFESSVQKVVKDYITPYAHSVETDSHGNLIACVNPSGKPRVMIAGHCDQLGFMVKKISKEGYIYVTALGGIDPGVIPGSLVWIHSKKGVVKGVFGRKPIHLQSAEERQKMSLELSKMWIDIGARSEKEARNYVEIGDPVTFELTVQYLLNDFVSAPGLDDKVGVFVAFETLRVLSKQKLSCAVYAVSTVQEEIGLRGAKTSAYSVNPDVGFAVDVTFSSDNPGSDEQKLADIKLGQGPAIVVGPNANLKVNEILFQLCKRKRIPYQLDPVGGALGNDANAIQVSKSGVATGSIGIPNRYMHTQVEICAFSDLENAVRLLAEFCLSLKPNSNFTLL